METNLLKGKEIADRHGVSTFFVYLFMKRGIIPSIWIEGMLIGRKRHNAGGRPAAYRTIRAFFLWYEDEVESQGWSNPIRKVKAPKVPLEPVSIDTASQMIKACSQNTFTDDRDAAILLCLLDTGARANEFLSVNLEDINQARGDILIRQGKGHKPRNVYIGKLSKRALRRNLNHRMDECPALWVTQEHCDVSPKMITIFISPKIGEFDGK
jgi:integrase